MILGVHFHIYRLSSHRLELLASFVDSKIELSIKLHFSFEVSGDCCCILSFIWSANWDFGQAVLCHIIDSQPLLDHKNSLGLSS